MGAMLARHVACSVFEAAGDGSATAVALLQGLLHQAHRYIAAGASPALVGQGITSALLRVVDALEVRARPIESRAELARVALGVVHDHALSAMIAEVVESVGLEGPCSSKMPEELSPALFFALPRRGSSERAAT